MVNGVWMPNRQKYGYKHLLSEKQARIESLFVYKLLPMPKVFFNYTKYTIHTTCTNSSFLQCSDITHLLQHLIVKKGCRFKSSITSQHLWWRILFLEQVHVSLLMFGQLYFYGVGPHDQVFFTGMLKRLYRNPWKCDFFMGCPNYPNFVGIRFNWSTILSQV